ncbi:MAG: VWA domain-containing protein [Myxococcales bacterium]|nr:VWA domain-containing protein [Myxococcales bacterium]
MNTVLAFPLGLLALLSLPAIVWLHRFAATGERRPVSWLGLWRDGQAIPLEGDRPRKPPITAVLLLELLAALLLSLLLAGFDLTLPPRRKPQIGLLIDSSASMGGGTAGSKPMQSIARVIAQQSRLLPDVCVSIVLAGSAPRLVGRGLSPQEALERIGELEPTDVTSRVLPAQEMLNALGVELESTWYFSDDPDADHPRLVRFGAPTQNHAIVAGGWQAGGDPFVVARGFSDVRSTVALEIRADDAPATTQMLELEPGREYPVTIDIPPEAHSVTIALPADDLPIDDRVVLLAPPDRGVALQVDHPNARLRRGFKRLAAGIPLLVRASGPGSLRVVSEPTTPGADSAPDGDPRRDVQGAGWTLRVPVSAEEAELAHELHLDPFSELLQGADMRGLVWRAYPNLSPSAPTKVLMRAAGRPIVWRVGRELTINADLRRGNLLEHPLFPILVHNLAARIDREAGGLTRSNYRQGEPFELGRGPGWQGTVALFLPGGEMLEFPPDLPIRVPALEQAGAYVVRSATRRARFFVNLFNARESDIARRAVGPAPSLKATWTPDDRRRSLLRTPIFLLAAACLLTAWSLALSRRSAR